MPGANKRELRKAMCDRPPHTGLQSEELSGMVVKIVEAMPEFIAARTVALYRALPGEVSMEDLILGWRGRKRIVLPAVDGGVMIFKEYKGEEDMRRGAFGIPEPVSGAAVAAQEVDLVVVPGVAFSRCGQRLGRGKGFYDRFLAGSPAYKVGVCFGENLVDEIDCDPHDVDMDAVVAPSGVVFRR